MADTAAYAAGTEDRAIGARFESLQDELASRGSTLEAHVRGRYAERWRSPALAAALSIRTGLVLALHEFLAGRGLVNIDRVSISPVTDPLAHGVERVPVVEYKGVPYRTTHSMIYAKLLACMNTGVRGVFVDSPNIRLELPDPSGAQRGKYLVDFSQMDVEFRRSLRIGEAMYREEPETVACLLELERDRALAFFEDMIVAATSRLARRHGVELAALGVGLEPPVRPFPRFDRDEAIARHGADGLEAALGAEAGTQFFWITGLLRENYDLVYPCLDADGAPRPRASIRSREVYNYDLCAAARFADGSLGPAWEVLSGGLREWLYPVIARRLVANGVLAEEPRFAPDGRLLNIAALGGYGPFLLAARLRGEDGLPLFPETAGGGLGIERFLYALLRGSAIRNIEDLTLFGKNPDSADIYLF
ncbi:MAG: hypothetical protein JXA15_03560 [Spirochaetales bacterium]|nr:hypothetical protein [Spirochaetales bacterium]